MDDDFSTGTSNFDLLFDWSPISSPKSPTSEKAEAQMLFPFVEESPAPHAPLGDTQVFMNLSSANVGDGFRSPSMISPLFTPSNQTTLPFNVAFFQGFSLEELVHLEEPPVDGMNPLDATTILGPHSGARLPMTHTGLSSSIKKTSSTDSRKKLLKRFDDFKEALERLGESRSMGTSSFEEVLERRWQKYPGYLHRAIKDWERMAPEASEMKIWIQKYRALRRIQNSPTTISQTPGTTLTSTTANTAPTPTIILETQPDHAVIDMSDVNVPGLNPLSPLATAPQANTPDILVNTPVTHDGDEVPFAPMRMSPPIPSLSTPSDALAFLADLVNNPDATKNTVRKALEVMMDCGSTTFYKRLKEWEGTVEGKEIAEKYNSLPSSYSITVDTILNIGDVAGATASRKINRLPEFIRVVKLPNQTKGSVVKTLCEIWPANEVTVRRQIRKWKKLGVAEVDMYRNLGKKSKSTRRPDAYTGANVAGRIAAVAEPIMYTSNDRLPMFEAALTRYPMGPRGAVIEDMATQCGFKPRAIYRDLKIWRQKAAEPNADPYVCGLLSKYDALPKRGGSKILSALSQ